MPIAFILGVDSNGGIGKDGFRAGGGDTDEIVVQVVEKVFSFLVVDFKIREGGAALGTVVGEAFCPIDKPVLMEFIESLEDIFLDFRLETVVVAGPVKRKAKFFHLVLVKSFVDFDEVADEAVKGLAVKVKAALTFFGEFFFEDVLGFDAGVVASRQPKGGVAEHAVVANKNVFNGKKGVTHVDGVAGVGKGKQNSKGFLFFVYFVGEITTLFPQSINFILVELRLVKLVHEGILLS